jgi:hypothetical protein
MGERVHATKARARKGASICVRYRLGFTTANTGSRRKVSARHTCMCVNTGYHLLLRKKTTAVHASAGDLMDVESAHGHARGQADLRG